MGIIAAMWRSIHEWKELVNKWVRSPFEYIDTNEISLKAEHYTKIVLRV